MPKVITENLDLWTSALLSKSTAGRGSNAKQEAYGIKKLRGLILELAVRGKLVPQYPSDEPASVLLERMAQKKARLVKEGVLRKQKESSPIADDEIPFALPSNWNVERLGVISHLITKGTTPTTLGLAYVNSGISFVKVENIDRGRIQGDSISQFIDEKTDQALERSRLAAGDVLFSIAGTIGKTCIVYEQDLPANTNQALALIRGTATVFDARYLLIQLDSYVAEATRAKARGGAMPNISLGDLTNLVLPVPPIAEQHRIIAKVDELMALCDQLEQQQTDNIAAHQTLVETLLGTLTQAADTQAFTEAWNRIAEHFDALFTTEHSIDQLKQTILQLAVMGRLVPQEPSDEPASELLKRIFQEKERFIKEGKIKKQNPLPEISKEEKPFDLPIGWEWVRWDNVAMKIGDIDHKMPEQVDEGIPYVSPRDFFPNNRIDLEGAKKISVEDFRRLSAKIQPQRGDIIYPRYGTIGENRLVVTDVDFLASYSCCVIKTLQGFISPSYQFIFSISELTKQQAKKAENKTTQANVGINSIQRYLIPIPPLAEQHRIVTKVDELIALCNVLKAGIAAEQITQIHLADAIVEQAVA